VDVDGMAEWLEADRLGGFASGTVSGPRTRRYHALLLVAATPPTGRLVLVNGLDAHVQTRAGNFALSSQRYAPDAVHPDGQDRIENFRADPWPRWTFALEDGTRIEQELFVPHGRPSVALRWRLTDGITGATLEVRPFLSGRDYHSLHRENSACNLGATSAGARVVWRPYPAVPAITALSNGEYRQAPLWYHDFLYNQERARGLDDTEDLAAPGSFRWDLSRGPAICLFGAEDALPHGRSAQDLFRLLRDGEQARRAAFSSRLVRAADAYVVQRGAGKSIVAGYPWFTDWGRDTFIALRGLCLAGGRLDDARDTLTAWAGTVSEGMLPNRFLDSGDAPEFNSVDASLWFIVAAHEYLQAALARDGSLPEQVLGQLRQAIQAILTGYARGTRHGIRADEDGLLAAGEPGLQLTWMDAKAGDWVVTPRIGKPVEVQALWLNALAIGAQTDARWQALFERARSSFLDRFWNSEAGCLYDVVDVDHRRGAVDPACRPNQLFAIGGLPLTLLDVERGRRVVDLVEAKLWTPLGPRSLAREDGAYQGRYQGGVLQRDGAYHQGTVWPWLAGPFVEAWVRVRGGTDAVKREARERFLGPLLQHLDVAGLGHISEIADGDAPHRPGGCLFQAWSLGEILRLDRSVLRTGSE
jgi:predicted glycogen debranching enzyme